MFKDYSIFAYCLLKRNKMKIKKLILWAVMGKPGLKKKIKEALGVSDPTMTRILQNNSDDLTKAASMQIIRQELQLTDEEILEKE